MGNYIFDGHKLTYHIDRVGEFIKEGDCFPLYMEVSPTGSCNHKCVFCAYDFIGYPNRKLETDRFLTFIDEMAECGVKSLLYAGEGEPLIHPDIDKFIVHSKKQRLDIGMYTNGHLLNVKRAEKILSSLTFIRFSFNGGTRENYSAIHRVKPETFDKVVKNIETSVKIKKEEKLDLDIGAQYVLMPENLDFLIDAVKVLKNAGIDYFVIKPFIQQSYSQSYQMKSQISLDNINHILDEVENFSDQNFKVVARKRSFEDYGNRGYKHCYGTSFVTVLNSAGDIASCLPYWDKEEFVFGNIYKGNFKKIWLGQRRREIKRYLEERLNTDKCSPNCRPNAINEFLWEVKNPSVKHLNFV